MTQPAQELLAEVMEHCQCCGDGENDREEFYCPLCKAHDLDYTKIPHTPDCLFTRISAHLATGGWTKVKEPVGGYIYIGDDERQKQIATCDDKGQWYVCWLPELPAPPKGKAA